MKIHLQRAVFAVFCLALLAGSPAFAGAAEFESLSFEKLEKLVADNKGKIVMINFFATWCPPCKEEIPSLISIRKDIGEDRLILIGASVDEDKDELRKFVAKSRLNYPVQLAGEDLVQAAGVSGIPHMLVFDGDGDVIANAPGLVSEEDLRGFLKKHMGKK